MDQSLVRWQTLIFKVSGFCCGQRRFLPGNQHALKAALPCRRRALANQDLLLREYAEPSQ